VTDPLEKITLALKPKAPPEGASKTKSSTPEVLPSGVDAAVLDELRQATRTFDYLRKFGEPIEFWEAVRLARARRGVTEDAADSGKGVDEGLVEELRVIRRQLSPMVQDLRRYLKRVPDLPPPGESLEVSLGFLLASSKEHKAVAKWLSESDEHLLKAASKLRSLFEIAAPYLEVLRPWNWDGKPPIPADAMQEAQFEVADVPLDFEMLDNLRRAVWCRKLFAEMQLETAFWELLMLNSAERVPTQARQMRIVQAYKDKQMAVMHEETRALHSRLMPIRARHSQWIDAFMAWLREIPGTPKDEGLFELSVAFAVVEPDGPERARRWMAAPEASAKAAAAHLAKLAMKAKAYVAAMRKPVA
jgi:hypothetical protein